MINVRSLFLCAALLHTTTVLCVSRASLQSLCRKIQQLNPNGRENRPLNARGGQAAQEIIHEALRVLQLSDIPQKDHIWFYQMLIFYYERYRHVPDEVAQYYPDAATLLPEIFNPNSADQQKARGLLLKLVNGPMA